MLKKISRRAVLQGAAIGTVLATGASGKAAVKLNKKPNIIFILADDLGYADLSSYGHPTIRTPAIDKIGNDGVRLLQAYSNSPVCSATRTAIMTGQYQYRLALGLEEPLAGRDIGLPPSQTTLPSLLKQAGYETTLIGKWHLGAYPKYGPLKSGYDHFYGFRGSALSYYNHGKDFWEDDAPVEKAGYFTDLLGDKTVELIQKSDSCERPFFASVHFNAPHWPWEAPGEQGKKEAARKKNSLAAFDAGTQDVYRQIVERMDFQVGRILQALTDKKIRENTIVVFTSDNGGERFSNTWPFSGKKSELLEGGIRIPSLICWPAKIPSGQTSEQVTLSMDWLPTLLEAAETNVDQNHQSDGLSILPMLKGDEGVKSRTVFWRYKGNAQRAARMGDYKYLKILTNEFLFNVVDDPLERANLKNLLPDVYDEVRLKWKNWNKNMLPESADSQTYGFTGANFADHIGAQAVTTTPNNK
ncbi:sulfatase-like hydrolase/transferase [Phyllobacterium sp. YR531]|uniref:sulfatase family protein n=1 Tax=Phyllobacterium sp. YR531 TaxID=1144343 RepID=UPI00026F8701|nr:sulfatase-like hydrolase/transferase [Phyllobacterium sp. YR531]EJN04023.1 arylsulfatase A family protein [Phyllobacterium sp. YR531]